MGELQKGTTKGSLKTDLIDTSHGWHQLTATPANNHTSKTIRCKHRYLVNVTTLKHYKKDRPSCGLYPIHLPLA